MGLYPIRIPMTIHSLATYLEDYLDFSLKGTHSMRLSAITR